MASELNLPLLKLESNFQNVIPQNHHRTHIYLDSLAIYSLQKLWRIYYHSSGYSFKEFSLSKNMDVDPANYEPLLLDCFSISALKIFSTGSECDRNDKVDFIADNPVVQKHLHVCIRKATNCGKCSKCLRTLLSLDAANKLDNFREAFDIDSYIKRRGKIYQYLYEQAVLKQDPLFTKSYAVLSRRHKKFFAKLKAKTETQLEK